MANEKSSTYLEMDSKQIQLVVSEVREEASERFVPSTQTWRIAKIALLALSMISCTVILGISIALAANPNVESILIIWMAPQSAVGLCSSTADLVTMFGRSQKDLIRPEAHLALQLFLWLGFCAAAGLTGYLLSFALQCDYYCLNYSYYYSFYSAQYVSAMKALLAFTSPLL